MGRRLGGRGSESLKKGRKKVLIFEIVKSTTR